MTSVQAQELLIDDHLVLVRPDGDRLFLLNPTARLIWQLLQQQRSREQIIDDLVAVFGINEKQVSGDLDAILHYWQQEGVLTPNGFFADEQINNPLPFQPLDKITSTADFTPEIEKDYRLFDLNFRLRFAQKHLERLIHPLLYNLETSSASSMHVDINIAMRNRALDDVIAGLMHDLLNLGCRRQGLLTVLHAAAVSDGQQCLVFPARGGSGKTTLVATLVAAGLFYFSDDAVPIFEDTLEAVPVPVPLCIKAGSWPLLIPLCPALEEQAVFRRHSQPVRFLPVTDIAQGAVSEQRMTVSSLVFPQYKAGVEARLIPISPVNALQHLIKSDALLEKPLVPDKIARLLEWLQDTPAYELSYESLTQARTLVFNLL